MLQHRSFNNTPEHRGKSADDSNTLIQRHNNNIHHNTTNSMPPSKPPDDDPAPEPRTQASEFTQSLASITVPPGPDYYAARRELWLKPSGNATSTTKTTAKSDDERPPILKKLDELLELGADSDKAWKDGVGRVWKGLITGGHLRWRLPMNQVVKVVHAGWMRDGETWPRGAVAPEPDDILKVDEAETSSFPKAV